MIYPPGFKSLEEQLKGKDRKRLAVAGAKGGEVFSALMKAEQHGLIESLLVGNPTEVRWAAQTAGLEHYRVVEADSPEETARIAVNLVRDGEADLLMKGNIPTASLLSAVLAEKVVFNRQRLLSHLAVLEGPDGRLLGVSDGGLNIHPDIDQKHQIVQNAVDTFHRLGFSVPKVAVLAAMEKDNPRIPESMDARVLSRRQDYGQIENCIVDGPLALDLAVSKEACYLKNYQGKIAGDADILVSHDISGGNYLAKSLIYLGGWQGGGIIVGAGRPIILLSRSDMAREKFNSMLLALSVSEATVS